MSIPRIFLRIILHYFIILKTLDEVQLGFTTLFDPPISILFELVY